MRCKHQKASWKTELLLNLPWLLSYKINMKGKFNLISTRRQNKLSIYLDGLHILKLTLEFKIQSNRKVCLKEEKNFLMVAFSKKFYIWKNSALVSAFASICLKINQVEENTSFEMMTVTALCHPVSCWTSSFLFCLVWSDLIVWNKLKLQSISPIQFVSIHQVSSWKIKLIWKN